jgi:hypothetical protein
MALRLIEQRFQELEQAEKRHVEKFYGKRSASRGGTSRAPSVMSSSRPPTAATSVLSRPPTTSTTQSKLDRIRSRSVSMESLAAAAAEQGDMVRGVALSQYLSNPFS